MCLHRYTRGKNLYLGCVLCPDSVPVLGVCVCVGVCVRVGVGVGGWARKWKEVRVVWIGT